MHLEKVENHVEYDKATEAKLEGKAHKFIIDEPFHWDRWAAPKDRHGAIHHNKAKTGDDNLDFVNDKLFPCLQKFKRTATGANTIEYKIGELFGEIKNKVASGYNLREMIDRIDALPFGSQKEKHELSHLYEAKIRNNGTIQAISSRVHVLRLSKIGGWTL
ncbi:MAG TPA: hypothetical protein VNJ04_20950 [Gemmatimonadaceae bacterium]|nr:hypothetical protein [Gemmatimonadaceae bacterium]